VAGSVFVDCYAGSGAVGLEALSRGAAQVFWIEENSPAVRAIENNLAALGGSPQARIVRARASAGLRRLEQQGVQARWPELKKTPRNKAARSSSSTNRG
jgi:16S rRNA (guanine966-N2)-methyltransferase